VFGWGDAWIDGSIDRKNEIEIERDTNTLTKSVINIKVDIIIQTQKNK